MKSGLVIAVLCLWLGSAEALCDQAQPCADRQMASLPIAPEHLVNWAGSSLVAVQYLAPGAGQELPWYAIDIRVNSRGQERRVDTHVALDPLSGTSEGDLAQAYYLYMLWESEGERAPKSLHEYRTELRNMARLMSLNARIALLSLFSDKLERLADPESFGHSLSSSQIYLEAKTRSRPGRFIHDVRPILTELAEALEFLPTEVSGKKEGSETLYYKDKLSGRIVVVSLQGSTYASKPVDNLVSKKLLGTSQSGLAGARWNVYEVRLSNEDPKVTHQSHPDVSILENNSINVGTLRSYLVRNRRGSAFNVVSNDGSNPTFNVSNLYLRSVTGSQDVGKDVSIGPIDANFSASADMSNSMRRVGAVAGSSNSWDTELSAAFSYGDHTSVTVESQGDNSRVNPFQILSIRSELKQNDENGISVTNVFLPAPNDDSLNSGYHHTEFGFHHVTKIAGGKVELWEQSNFFTRPDQSGMGFYGKSGINFKTGKAGNFSIASNYGLDPTVIVPVNTAPPSSLGVTVGWQKKVHSREYEAKLIYRRDDPNYSLHQDVFGQPEYGTVPKIGFGLRYTWGSH